MMIAFRKSVYAAIVLAAVLGGSVFADGMDRSRFNVGAYFLSPWVFSEERVKEFADCGLGFVVLMQNDRAHLDLLHKYGLGAIVTKVVPGSWAQPLPPGEGRIGDRVTDAMFEKSAGSFVDHPAIWGIDIGDEPSAIDYPYYAHVVKEFNGWFHGKMPFLNLFPEYALWVENREANAKNPLGAPSYRDYIAQYCRQIPLDYISYDYYLYEINVQRALKNLNIVANACRGTGKSMWIVLQVNSEKKERWIAENQLRFQAYTAMAYGAETIMWACYSTGGWWHNQVLDGKGNKTQQYDKLKKVNAELNRFGPHYMRYRNVASFLVGDAGTNKWFSAETGQTPIKAFGDEVFRGLAAKDGGPLVVGAMVSRSGDGGRAAFVCAADDPYDQTPTTRTISFRCAARGVKVLGSDGEIELFRDGDGRYSFSLMSNRAALIMAEPYGASSKSSFTFATWNVGHFSLGNCESSVISADKVLTLDEALAIFPKTGLYLNIHCKTGDAAPEVAALLRRTGRLAHFVLRPGLCPSCICIHHKPRLRPWAFHPHGVKRIGGIHHQYVA